MSATLIAYATTGASNNPGAGLVEFQTATNISFATSNWFISFGAKTEVTRDRGRLLGVTTSFMVFTTALKASR